MDDFIARSLAHGQVIDITTTGRRSGEARRIEIVLHNIDGRLYITGMPRPGHTRAWILNLSADAHLTLHLKRDVQADVPATARVITDAAERRTVFDWVARNAWPNVDVRAMLDASPLIEVTVDDLAA